MTELVTKLDLEAALDRVTPRMTVRFGVMLVAGLGALAYPVILRCPRMARASKDTAEAPGPSPFEARFARISG
jgi:hypothetical protein